MEVAKTSNDVISERLPFAGPDGHAVLVLEEAGALRTLAIPVDPGALPLVAHLTHSVINERRFREGVPAAEGQKRALDGFVHESPRPHLTRPELLQDVERASRRFALRVPATPGTVVLVV